MEMNADFSDVTLGRYMMLVCSNKPAQVAQWGEGYLNSIREPVLVRFFFSGCRWQLGLVMVVTIASKAPIDLKAPY